MKRIRAVLLLLTLLSAFVVFTGAASAHATPGAQGQVVRPLTQQVQCGSPGYSTATFYTQYAVYCYRGAGNLSVNLPNVDWFYANGWSGYIIYQYPNDPYHTQLAQFCNNDVDYFGGDTIIDLNLSATPASWC